VAVWILRVALQLVTFFVLVSIVVAIATATIGIVETLVLVAIVAALVWLWARLRRFEAAR
jgi:hypothetical protein